MRINHLKIGFEKLTKEKVRVIAHLIGDGCAYKTKSNYYIRYEVKDEDLLEQFEKDLVATYGLPITRGLNESGKKPGSFIPFVYARSKLALEDLHRYCQYSSTKWIVPQQIIQANSEIKKEFLKALFDDEGSVIPKPDNCVRLYSINLKGLEQIKDLLEEFGIVNRIAPGYGAKRTVFAIVIKDMKSFYGK